jgi:hypothetical protein
VGTVIGRAAAQERGCSRAALAALIAGERLALAESIQPAQHFEATRGQPRKRVTGRKQFDLNETFMSQTRRFIPERFHLIGRTLDQEQRGNLMGTQHSVLQGVGRLFEDSA